MLCFQQHVFGHMWHWLTLWDQHEFDDTALLACALQAPPCSGAATQEAPAHPNPVTHAQDHPTTPANHQTALVNTTEARAAFCWRKNACILHTYGSFVIANISCNCWHSICFSPLTCVTLVVIAVHCTTRTTSSQMWKRKSKWDPGICMKD